jgi:hypothetical protein
VSDKVPHVTIAAQIEISAGVESTAVRLPERKRIKSRKFPQEADYCRFYELLDRMRCAPRLKKSIAQ